MKLVVSSIEKKRLFLDFTQETIEIAVEEASAKVEAKTKEESEATIDDKVTSMRTSQADNQVEDDDEEEERDPYADDAAAWAAYYQEDYVEEEEDDDYDEDRNIEDALGIGYY